MTWYQPGKAYENVRRALNGFPVDTEGTSWNEASGRYVVDALQAHAFGHSLHVDHQQVFSANDYELVADSYETDWWLASRLVPLGSMSGLPVLVTSAGCTSAAPDTGGSSPAANNWQDFRAWITVEPNQGTLWQCQYDPGTWLVVSGNWFLEGRVNLSQLPCWVYPKDEESVPTIRLRVCCKATSKPSDPSEWNTYFTVYSAECQGAEQFMPPWPR